MSYIDIASVGNGVLNEQPRTILVSEAPSRAQRLVCAGDTIVSTVRPNRRSFLYVGKPAPVTVVSTGFAVLRAGVDIDPRFLYYLVTNQAFTDYLVAHEEGSAYPAVSVDVLSDAEVTIPSYPEQRAIARILGTLDDKIELNRQMNETLESMARSLFKSWFIDFDPVHAKADGRDPGLPADIAALFPDSFQASELGEIPKGWEVGTTESLCESITSGGTPARMNPAYWINGTIPWFKTGELLDGPLIRSEENITEAALEASSCKLWPAGTILFALYASPTVGRLGVLTCPSTSNQAAAGLIAKPEYGVPFLRRTLLEARVRLQTIAVGAAQQNINQNVLKSHHTVIPCAGAARAYSQLVSSWDEQQVSMKRQADTLCALRDTLLPRLLSGELDTRDVQDAIALADGEGGIDHA